MFFFTLQSKLLGDVFLYIYFLILEFIHSCVLMYNVDLYESSLQSKFNICFDIVEYFLIWFKRTFITFNVWCIKYFQTYKNQKKAFYIRDFTCLHRHNRSISPKVFVFTSKIVLLFVFLTWCKGRTYFL